MRIRLAVSLDVPSILALERSCLTAAHWSEEQYLALFRPGEERLERLVLINESVPTAASDEASASVDGFLIACNIRGEWELENIVVARDARRRGIGRQLLEALFAAARKTDGASVFLEVRESNVAARGLYEKLGFRETGRRRDYYANPSEDAIVYHIDLP